MSKGQQAIEGVEDLKQRQRKEKGKTRKREIKLAKEGAIKKQCARPNDIIYSYDIIGSLTVPVNAMARGANRRSRSIH